MAIIGPPRIVADTTAIQAAIEELCGLLEENSLMPELSEWVQFKPGQWDHNILTIYALPSDEMIALINELREPWQPDWEPPT